MFGPRKFRRSTNRVGWKNSMYYNSTMTVQDYLDELVSYRKRTAPQHSSGGLRFTKHIVEVNPPHGDDWKAPECFHEGKDNLSTAINYNGFNYQCRTKGGTLPS